MAVLKCGNKMKEIPITQLDSTYEDVVITIKAKVDSDYNLSQALLSFLNDQGWVSNIEITEGI